MISGLLVYGWRAGVARRGRARQVESKDIRKAYTRDLNLHRYPHESEAPEALRRPVAALLNLS
jgi:hypothetical protein